MKHKQTITITAAIAMLVAFAILRDTRHVDARDGLSIADREQLVTDQKASEVSGANAIEHLRASGQYESLDAAVRAARYEAEASETGAAATNYANQMRGVFTPAGSCLESNASDAQWRSCWRLQSLGHGEDQLTVGEGEVAINGDRVTISHTISTPDGPAIGDPQSQIINEWFDNSPDGLEHGFTLPERLGENAGMLHLRIAVDGDLRPQADADGQILRLVNKQGDAVLNYEKLKVWDADGVEIPARMTTENGSVILDVEDAAAKYPLVIDPTFSTAAKLMASDGADGDWFGTSVAISGDTVIVGAKFDDVSGHANQGSAYIFVRGTNGLWTQQAKLTAADGEADDNFGGSVGIAGDTVVVGAPLDAIGSNANQGSAYVYVRSGTTWAIQEKLVAGDVAGNDVFGFSVAIAGDTVVAGAFGDDIGGNTDQGSAYVFVRNGAAWTQQQKLTAADGVDGDFFGNSVAFGGGTAIIGAYRDDIGGDIERGSAYVFTRSGTTWTQQQRLTASDGTELDHFGWSVDIAAGVESVIVGSPDDDIGGISDRGSAYVFTRTGTVWTLQQKITASEGEEYDHLGFSVGMFGDTAIVGTDDSIGASHNGSAYVYERSGTVWTQKQKLTAFDGAGIDVFGTSVAVSGDTAVVGAFGDDIGTNDDQGSVYVFRLGSKPFDFDDDGKADLSIFRPSVGEWYYQRSSNGITNGFGFGSATDRVTPADLTGDGKTDIAFWRPSTGEWYVLRSEDSTFYAFPFGASGDIAAPADFDGDGKADAAVFRPSIATWFVLRSSDGGVTSTQFGISTDKPEPSDYDGDGRADVAIWRSGPGQWWILKSSNNSVFAAQFGSSADSPTPGDFTGDGKSDIAFWRPANGTWYVLRSEDFSFYAFPFGANGDKPVAADYDGDGKFDAAVFRPSDTNWYILKSGGGLYIQQYGLTNDIPLPNAFVR